MNDQLQPALAEILNKSMSGIDAASEFLLAETPEVIQQLLLWYAVYSGIWFIICCLALLSVILSIKWAIKHEKKADYHDAGMYATFAGFYTAIIFLITVFTIDLDWLKIWIAPKIWLIEYAASLAK